MHRIRILLVDDYSDALKVWSETLVALGYDVLTAGTGERAVELTALERPDAIVLDLDLPGISGCEAARRIRRLSVSRWVPLIAATGSSDAARLEEARGSGFDSILTKPCEAGDLMFEIERLLDLREVTVKSGHHGA